MLIIVFIVPEHVGGIGEVFSVQIPGADPTPPILQVCNEIIFPPEVSEVCWIVREEISRLPILLKLRKVSQTISQDNANFRQVRRFDTATSPLTAVVTAEALAPATTAQLPEVAVEKVELEDEALIEASDNALLVMDKRDKVTIAITNNRLLITLMH